MTAVVHQPLDTLDFVGPAQPACSLEAAPDMTTQLVLGKLKADLALFGLDVVVPFSIGWYNKAVPEGLGCRIPTASSPAGKNTLAVLVGNTRNVWQPFLEACKYCTELLRLQHPLDTYVEKTIQAIAEPLFSGQYRCYWSHRVAPDLVGGGDYVAMQRLAHAVGLAYLDTDSHLCLHPKYGPWFGLRCVLVFDGVAYTGPRPPVLRSPLCAQTQKYVQMLVASAQHAAQTTAAEGAESGAACGPGKEAVRASWQRWLAVRDATCPGHPWRYSHDQLVYHYTRDRKLLVRAVRAVRSVADD